MKRLCAPAFIAFVLMQGVAAQAAEITLFAPGGIRAAVEEMIPGFENATGHKVHAVFGSGGATKQHVVAGEAFEVAIVQAPLDQILASGNIDPASAKPLANVLPGIAVKEGAAKPDISTPDAAKKALLAAKSITSPDPASGATVAGVLAKTYETLGVSEAVQAKTVRRQGVPMLELVRSGDAEMVVTFASELDGPGVAYVGTLPASIASPSTMVAYLSAHAKEETAAKALVAYLSSAQADDIYTAHHMTPAR